MTTIPHPAGGGRQQPDPKAYTITDAAYANEASDGAIITTRESGAVAISPADTPALWDAMLAWAADPGHAIAAYVPPPPPPPDPVLAALAEINAKLDRIGKLEPVLIGKGVIAAGDIDRAAEVQPAEEAKPAVAEAAPAIAMAR